MPLCFEENTLMFDEITLRFDEINKYKCKK